MSDEIIDLTPNKDGVYDVNESARQDSRPSAVNTSDNGNTKVYYKDNRKIIFNAKSQKHPAEEFLSGVSATLAVINKLNKFLG